jgi:Polyketide cyclase / dehydrase and lipid transport
MLKKIAIVIVALVAGILIFAATKPDTFHFERSITINAAPDKIQPLIADFHQWTTWSPWEKLDPNMKRTYSGPESGVGAIYVWEGNSDVGAGRMEVTDATPTEVDIKLDFTAPMATSNMTKFVLAPSGDTTSVVWSMDGPMPYVSKLMTVFVSMESLLSKDFETGLAQLKATAEAAPAS